MDELKISELDDRLQKQLHSAREALVRGGVDYIVQICGELLKHHPGAFEVRDLLWKALYSEIQKSSGLSWLNNKSSGFQFKLSTRSLLKTDPLALLLKCDELLRAKQIFTELFVAMDKAAEALGWLESRVVACKALSELESEKVAPRLALAQVLIEVGRPQQAIESLEWVLSKEPSNASAQTLLKNASVAETLQRGNWEDTGTSFHSKKQS